MPASPSQGRCPEVSIDSTSGEKEMWHHETASSQFRNFETKEDAIRFKDKEKLESFRVVALVSNSIFIGFGLMDKPSGDGKTD